MKNKKWLSYTLGTLLTLIALAAVGLAAFRVGMMQNVSFPHTRPAFHQETDKNLPTTQGANPGDNDNQKGDNNFGNNPQGNDFKQHGFDRGHRGMSMVGGLFGLIHLAILALLLWFGYKLVQKSGWRLVRVQTDVPVETATIAPEVEKKKKSK
jgi:hypothetical protein